MELQQITLDSVDIYNKLMGLPTLHPLVAVVDLKEATKVVNNARLVYGVYALFLKNGVQCTLKYGRKKYDYQEGSVVSFAPGQVVDVIVDEAVKSPGVQGLLFHPDLIYGTPLAEKIDTFGFFDYWQMESLHLSETEKVKFLECLDLIREEIAHPVDKHSAMLLSANIQLLLEYMHRFYDRQFVTRHKANSDVVSQFRQNLRGYYESGLGSRGMPGVAYFAEKANLSPGYFGDLIRKETGTSPKDMISLHVIAIAKQKLAATRQDISEVAYALGFDYPAHFSRMFKRLTGQSPSEYRQEFQS